MPTPQKNTSQKSSENSKLTLQEMPIDYQSPSLHSEIAGILKHMVTQSIAQIVVTPQVQMAEPTSYKVGRRKAEISMSMEISIPFQLPTDCIINKIDMDKVALSYQNFIVPQMEGKLNLTPQFSFRERLKGWNIERMQRENGTYEVFYCHSKSGWMFRYINEVVHFLQYEIYSDDIQNFRVKHISKEASTMKRKREPTSSNGILKRHEAFSGKQAVSYDTLMVEGENTIEFQADGSLENVVEILKNVKIDQNEVKPEEYPELRDIISMDWDESLALIIAYLDECDLIFDVPICESLHELVHFLIAKRNERQG